MWSNNIELTRNCPVGQLSSSIAVVRGCSVWSNHLKLTRTYPVGLLPPSSPRFGVVEPLRIHSKLPGMPSSPSSEVVRGGSVWSNLPELT